MRTKWYGKLGIWEGEKSVEREHLGRESGESRSTLKSVQEFFLKIDNEITVLEKGRIEDLNNQKNDLGLRKR